MESILSFLKGLFCKNNDKKQTITKQIEKTMIEKGNHQQLPSDSKESSSSLEKEEKSHTLDSAMKEETKNIAKPENISTIDILPSEFSDFKTILESIQNNIKHIETQIEKISAGNEQKVVQDAESETYESVKNIELNVQQLVQNQTSAADVAVMRRENEAYRSDSNIKLMRAYGIDAMIKTYQGICDQLFKLNHFTTETAEGEKKAYSFVLKKMERQFHRLGIKLQKSDIGDSINEDYMEIYGSDGSVDVDEELTIVATENSNLQNTVKESVCPAFIWTIPSLIEEQKEWVMEPEKICMYK